MLIKTGDNKEANVTKFGQGVYNTVGASAGIAALLGMGANNNNGLLGNLLGNNQCDVSLTQFYENELNDRDREFANFNHLNDKICALAQRVAVDETAIAYQNKLTDKQFECVDKEMGWDRLATTYQIEAATCHCIKGDNFLSPSQLADPYIGRRNVIATCSPCGGYYGGFYGYGGDCGCY